MNSNLLYDRIISKLENSISSNNLFNLIIDNKFQEILNDINKISNILDNNFKIDVITYDNIHNNCMNINLIRNFQNYDEFINNQIKIFYISLANSYIKNNNNYLYYFLIYKIYKDLERFNQKVENIDGRLLNITSNFQDSFNYYFIDTIREKYDKKIRGLNDEIDGIKNAIIVANMKLQEFEFRFNILFYFSIITSLFSLIIYMN